eukprot:TRINITY_DN8938_c0_g5_i1.p1 TRINITY_DN8938_c0_g5~~TRINITY_DN8938_c0_g5_i1.p1  ORF type:complete len:244 (-),score=50.12 TRINITY_DN8938_c0_g5_i1:262-993(-)
MKASEHLLDATGNDVLTWAGNRSSSRRSNSTLISFASDGDRKAKTLGRTAQGQSCGCTDPEQKSGWGAALGWLQKSHDDIADELRRQQRKAERANADEEMREPWDKFQASQGAYDAAMADLKKVLADYQKQRITFDKAFWDLKAAHNKDCTPLQNTYMGMQTECETNWNAALDQFLARRNAASCLVGHRSFVDSKAASMPLCPESLALFNRSEVSPLAGARRGKDRQAAKADYGSSDILKSFL